MNKLEFTFNVFNEYSSNGICHGLTKIVSPFLPPVFICVGSDLVLGDSLGPLVGTFLRRKNLSSFVYGTLNYPVTAKEISYAKTYLKIMHPNSINIAIDAAVGDGKDVGTIKLMSQGLKPGLGVNKQLGTVGDVSIIGVVAEKSNNNYSLFNLTRLSLIYKMAETIADGIELFVNEVYKNIDKNSAKIINFG